MRDMNKKVIGSGLILSIAYILVVGLFVVTQTDIALTMWEVITIVSAPVLLFVLLEMADTLQIQPIYRALFLVFMGCNCALTGLTHIINITVTRRLIAQGVEVPTYFQIGYWPSTEMAIDYLAWGFFMGLAYLCIAWGIRGEGRQSKFYRVYLLVCGTFCMIGFIGAVSINENLWYFAPLAYGVGTMLLCIKSLSDQSAVN